MSEQEEKLTQFIAITGANEDRAKFYLESSAWQVEVAIARYYENDGNDVELIDSSPQEVPTETKESAATNKAKSKSKPSNFATMNTLTTSSDEEEEGQAYYAGGSEHSGQQILGPPKKQDIVADMFKSVHEHGVEILEPSASSSSSRAFKGTGYKLGQDNNDTEIIPGAPEPSPPAEVTLRLWQNGFSVNDGDLRAYTDPQNKEFLDSIRRGEIPQELRQGTSEVHLVMEDHRMEAFKSAQKKKIVKAFQGHGYTLGSPAPIVIGAPCEEDKPANEAKAKDLIKVDDSKPTTNLQIRLADGSRLVGQFNYEHTIGEVRSYIQAARPQYQSQPFNLLSTYPSKVLDDAQTLQAAGLLNAAIMQKLI
ncbi:NSFL1 cofactor p47 [Anoplophora glabripennis]|uniref:NSFL1 cofactor p47 n=1 Tax=Anoplophora glabripennis TaxID=217634 RepID=V5H138_ANOGL|nr:NSFL1 cofactor p47 [Anoplophora glabripennis]